ncbi:hypothetical protein AC1031_008348 [Aphanomyces cochlioides]|nr:hypothetical protein AC1031_008348 [Aphanomyces cochlioides]
MQTNNQQVQDLKSQLAAITAAYDQHVLASNQVEEELDQQVNEALNQAAMWRHRAQQYEEELQRVRIKMSARTHEVGALQQQLTVTKDASHAMKMAKVAAENELDQLASEVRALQASNEHLQDQLDTAIEDKILLQTDYDETKTQLEVTCERLRAEIVHLKSELSVVQMRKKQEPTHDQALDSLIHDVMDDSPLSSTEDEDDTYTLEEALYDVTARLEEEQRRRRQVKAELVELQTQMDQIQLDSFETTQELIEKAERVNRAQDEVAHLKEALLSVQDQLALSKRQHDMERPQSQPAIDAYVDELAQLRHAQSTISCVDNPVETDQDQQGEQPPEGGATSQVSQERPSHVGDFTPGTVDVTTTSKLSWDPQLLFRLWHGVAPWIFLALSVTMPWNTPCFESGLELLIQACVSNSC